jgi:hydroxymethylpyrimidine pyrophosphatase-like HAD family hydrolase
VTPNVLALDYDGTVATDGVAGPEVVAALERWQRAGGLLIMVTGRERESLEEAFPEVSLFDRVVLENGALLWNPRTGNERLLAPPRPEGLVRALRDRGIPLSLGRSIVASWKPHDVILREVVQAQGLALQLIFNKDAVMVLPQGVDKGSGLRAALAELGRSTADVAAAGDAENDVVLLEAAGLKVAVANALPVLKDQADWITIGARGDGIRELVDRLLSRTQTAGASVP